MPSTIGELLTQVVKLWKEQVRLSRKDKDEKFQKTADRLWDFYGKRYRDMAFRVPLEEAHADFPHPQPVYYRPVLNKSKQFVDLYLPYVHSTLTHRLVRPRRPELPPELAQLGLDRPDVKQQEMIQSFLMEWFLNYVPTEYDAFGEQRSGLIDMLVTGRGIVWHELIPGPTGDIPASFHVPEKELLIDADARKFRDAGFIIRERWEPAYQLAEDWKIDVDKLRGQAKSNLEMARESVDDTDNGTRKGDLCRIYDIYSRIGIGHRLLSASDDTELKAFGEALDEFGPHVHLIIHPDLEHPLNLKPDDVEAYRSGPEMGEFIREQLSWPIRFYAEFSNPWPCSVADPYPDGAWATSPLEAGLPIQEEMDKTYYWIMQRVRRSCRDIIIYSAALETAVNNAMESSMDLEMVMVKDSDVKASLEKLVGVISFPEMKSEIWRVVQYHSSEFEKATGMTPLMHGMPEDRAMRSAQEAEYREQHTTSRPDDIAKVVQDWQSRISAKEAQATRLAVDAATVAPLFAEPGPPVSPETGMEDYEGWGQSEDGPMGPLTMLWLQLVQTDDPGQAAAEMHYTVEAGSGRRKNKQWLQAAAQTLLPLYMPLAQQEYMMGNPRKYNALTRMIGDGWEAPVDALMQPEDEQFAAQMQMMGAQQQPPPKEASNAPQ